MVTEFDISVYNNGEEQKGRLFSFRQNYALNERNANGTYEEFYVLGANGYLYNIKFPNARSYNAAYVWPSGLGAYDANNNYVAYDESFDRAALPSYITGGACVTCGDYKIFYEKPDSSMPAKAKFGNFPIELSLNPLPLEDRDNVASIDSFTYDNQLISKAGTFTYSIDPDYSGNYYFQIDTNNNGSYDDDVDISVLRGARGAFSTTTYESLNSNLTYIFDGKDGLGNDIPIDRTIKARLLLENTGKMYFAMYDFESNPGGIIVEKLNGSLSGDKTVYWDDTKLSTTGFTAINIPTQLDGTMGVDSSNGVHSWGAIPFSGLGWDDNERYVYNWILNPVKSFNDVMELKPSDHDHDGIPDYVEVGSDVNNPIDSDGDGIADWDDLDSDNDGIPDKIEAVNNDGSGDPTYPVDTDNDGIPDYLDTDSDNDTIPDYVEGDTQNHGDISSIALDTDQDGIPDNIKDYQPTDTDGDGVPDYRDIDSDDDAIPDSVEAINSDGSGDSANPVDTDGDGIPDYRDVDSDNDTLLDIDEVGPDPMHPQDSDNNGIPDYRQFNELPKSNTGNKIVKTGNEMLNISLLTIITTLVFSISYLKIRK
ncbi:MAG: hypothetical protein LBR40_04025 [Bacilli bacterium]|nr:hypothetical protein [Bacilli bacterium]